MAHLRLVQRRRRMEHRDHVADPDLFHLPMHGADLHIRYELAHRDAPQCHNDTWIDYLYLRFKMGITGRYLIRQRISVAGRTALDHIADEYFCAGHSACAE